MQLRLTLSRGPLSYDVDVAAKFQDKHGSQLWLVTMPCALRALQTKTLSILPWTSLKYPASPRSYLLPSVPV